MLKTQLHLREATMADAKKLFDWRNDPGTRANSRNSKPLLWEEHLEWLATTIARSDVRLYVVRFENQLVATIRFDYLGEVPEFSWTLAPERRGCGLSKAIARMIYRMEPAFFGYIKRENAAARACCAAAGMVLVENGELERWERQ